MKKDGEKRKFFYQSYTDDFVKSRKQEYTIPEKYVWIHRSGLYRFASWLVYKIATVVDFFYCKFILKIKVENGGIFEKYKKSGYFLFCNHTQVVGDAFIPTYVCNGKRVYIMVSPANLGIPVLGKILPMLGALPIPKTIRGLKEFKSAVRERAETGNCVVVYPEAHVWPYYTEIRPFSADAFRFSVESKLPTFCLTTTYQKPKRGEKPCITVYADGPFFPEEGDSLIKQRQELRDRVYECMVKRSHSSTYRYIHYEEEKRV